MIFQALYEFSSSIDFIIFCSYYFYSSAFNWETAQLDPAQRDIVNARLYKAFFFFLFLRRKKLKENKIKINEKKGKENIECYSLYYIFFVSMEYGGKQQQQQKWNVSTNLRAISSTSVRVRVSSALVITQHYSSSLFLFSFSFLVVLYCLPFFFTFTWKIKVEYKNINKYKFPNENVRFLFSAFWNKRMHLAHRIKMNDRCAFFSLFHKGYFLYVINLISVSFFIVLFYKM